MLNGVVFLLLVTGLASSFEVCPDRKVCPSGFTCCKAEDEYQCCPSLGESNSLPASMEAGSSVIRCNSRYTCPDFTTCCKHPAGTYTCCPYFRGRCCLDGFHCCPQGYHCDVTYTKCLKNNLPYPFASQEPATMIMATKLGGNQH